MDKKECNISWKTYSDHLRNMLHDMISSNELTDVTLVSDDKRQMKAHKVVLSACSAVFKSIIKNIPQNSSVIYLRGIQHQEMESILEFMYLGEAKLQQDRLQEFLNVVNDLEIKEISKNDKVAANDDNDIIEIENNQRNYEVTKFHLPETSDIADVAAGKLDNDEIAKNVINDTDTDINGADAEFINDKKREDINTLGNANDRDGKFYCNLCNQNELTRYDLYKHILKNHNKYTCHLCDKELAWRTWKNEEALSVHMNSKHTYLHCDECAYKTCFKYGYFRKF